MSVTTYSRFPAAVSSPTRSERRSAIVVAEGVARIAVQMPGGVEVVEEFPVAEVRSGNNRTTVIVADDGTEWVVARGDGCGCNSPLRVWYRDALGTPHRSGT